MPGPCSHEFFWPLRAADGHYYQVCRHCGVQCEYDWTNMRRVDGGSTATAGLSRSQTGAQLKALPRLGLLVELEPAYRVFFRNLFDLLRPTPVASASRTAPFWREVLYYSGVPWRRFGESLLCHVIAVAVVVIMSQTWTPQDPPRRRSVFENYHLSYYKPSGSFPALRGNPSRVRPFRKQSGASRGAPLRVAPERAQASIKAPDIKLNGPARPNLAASNLVLPAVPLASTRGSRLTVPAGPTSVVAPAPEVSQATSRRLGLPQAPVVAPAPEAGAVSSSARRVMTVPAGVIVGPPPMVQASIRRAGDINIGPTVVVAPAPRLPVGEQMVASGAAPATLGSPLGLAVPPPPSAPRAGTLAGGRAGSLSLSGGGLQVVPPAPSVQGVSNSGAGAGGGHMSAFSSGGLQAVPPTPSLQGAGNSAADRRGGALSSGGSNSGLQGVPPAPSVGAGGNSDRGGGRQLAMNIAPALAPASPAIIDNARPRPEKPPEPATEVMPLRLIGLAMALPSSSFFSNYEVFIAERRLRKDLTQLIKLVYVSLPYQRRLSEYGVDNSKVYRLRVSRDRTCDESLLQMTWPETDPHPDAHNSADSPALSANDRTGTLPCYRTTADDYHRALSRR
jgi:hypothetical protein